MPMLSWTKQLILNLHTKRLHAYKYSYCISRFIACKCDVWFYMDLVKIKNNGTIKTVITTV